MSDDIDRAQNEVEHALMEAMRARKPSGPPPTGYCLHCDESVVGTRRWCCVDCRDNWESENVRRRA